MPDISCKNVNLFYRKSQALKDVSFTLKENTICGLLGRNGSGKTSLMSLLASYRPASSGQILYGNQPVFDNPAAMPNIAFVYHRDTSDDNFKVRDYLKYHAALRPQWDDAYANRLLREFNIPAKKSVSSLSLGQQASIYAIIGLASRCPVTLYDEAYLGMDAAVRKFFIQEILDDYMRHPRTILFSTHFIGEIESMLEDVLVLDEGTVLIHENCDTLRSRGFALTGHTQAVDAAAARLGAQILSERTLGNQKELVLYGEISAQQKAQLAAENIVCSQPSLQDLFVHLTGVEHAASVHTSAA